MRAEFKSPIEREREEEDGWIERGRPAKKKKRSSGEGVGDMAERRSKVLPPRRVRLRREALGPSLSTQSLRLSFTFPYPPRNPLCRSYALSSQCLLLAASVRFSSALVFLICSLSFHSRPLSLWVCTCPPVELGETKGTWHSAIGTELRANSSDSRTFREAQHCLSRAAAPLHRPSSPCQLLFPEFCVHVVHLFTVLAGNLIP